VGFGADASLDEVDFIGQSSGGKFRAITLETQYWRLGIQLLSRIFTSAAPDYSVGID